MSRKPAMHPVRDSRRGITLLEVVVAIAVGAVLLATTFLLLSKIVNANAALRERAGRGAALADLATQLRRDARAASGLVPVDPGQSSRRLVLEHAAERIEYEIVDGKLQRTAWQGEKATARDVLSVPAASIEQFKIEPSVGRTLVSLAVRWHGPGDSAQGAGPPLAIDAVVGTDQRFVRTEQK